MFVGLTTSKHHRRWLLWGLVALFVVVIAAILSGGFGLRLVANALTTLHLVWVFFIIIGALLAIAGVLSRLPKLGVLYNAVLLVSIGSWLVIGPCLFTVWESQVRAQLGQTALTGGFLIYYLGKLGLTLTVEQLSTTTYIVLLIGLGAQLVWFGYQRLTKKHKTVPIQRLALSLLARSEGAHV